MGRASKVPTIPPTTTNAAQVTRAVESWAADLRRQFLDGLVENVSFTPEEARRPTGPDTHIMQWGLRVEYLFTTKDTDELMTGSWMHYHSGVTTEVALLRVVELLEAE